MGILRADRITGLGGANAIDGSVLFSADHDGTAWIRYIDAGISDDYNFGAGDFTIECWINRTSLSNDDTIWGTTVAEGSSGCFWYFNSSGNLRAYLGDSTERASSSNNILAGTWYHVALTRASGTVNIWVDGVSKYSASGVTGNIGSSTQNFIIGDGNTGYNGNAYMFLGHISNLRIQKGKAEYTATFTPPTTRLNVTPETVLLALQSPGNVLAEATGKTLSLVQSGTIGSNSAGIVASRFTPNSPVGFSTTSDVGSQYGSTFDGFGSFATSTYMVPPGGNTRERNRGRAIMAGGMMYPTIAGEEIDMLEIQSGGTTQAFGDLTAARSQSAPMSSSTRGVIAGGLDGSTRKNEIDFVTIASTGNATDFGDLSELLGYLGGVSNQTRGLILGGNGPSSPSNTNQIEFISIATAGNSADFGQLTRITNGVAGSGSPTRGLIFGGYVAPAVSDTIDYVTIASAGNATDFGNTTVARSAGASCSSSTRAIFGGGYTPSPTPSTELNVIDYVTIASTGNATDFGDLTVVGSYFGATSNGTRGIFGSRMDNQPYTGNITIDSVIIATTGNAVNWGDHRRMDSGPHDGQPLVRRSSTMMSDSHGGLT